MSDVSLCESLRNMQVRDSCLVIVDFPAKLIDNHWEFQPTDQMRDGIRDLDENRIRHFNRRQDKIRKLQRTHRVQSYVKEWITATVRSLERKTELTAFFLDSDLTNTNDEFKNLWHCYNCSKNEITWAREFMKNNDEKYNDSLDNHHIALHNFSRFTKKPADVSRNAWRSRKSRAKERVELCKLELDVAELGFQIQKLRAIEDLIETRRISMLEMFRSHFDRMSIEDQRKWVDLITNNGLDLPFMQNSDQTI